MDMQSASVDNVLAVKLYKQYKPHHSHHNPHQVFPNRNDEHRDELQTKLPTMMTSQPSPPPRPSPLCVVDMIKFINFEFSAKVSSVH